MAYRCSLSKARPLVRLTSLMDVVGTIGPLGYSMEEDGFVAAIAVDDHYLSWQSSMRVIAAG